MLKMICVCAIGIVLANPNVSFADDVVEKFVASKLAALSIAEVASKLDALKLSDDENTRLSAIASNSADLGLLRAGAIALARVTPTESTESIFIRYMETGLPECEARAAIRVCSTWGQTTNKLRKVVTRLSVKSDLIRAAES